MNVRDGKTRSGTRTGEVILLKNTRPSPHRGWEREKARGREEHHPRRDGATGHEEGNDRASLGTGERRDASCLGNFLIKYAVTRDDDDDDDVMSVIHVPDTVSRASSRIIPELPASYRSAVVIVRCIFALNDGQEA